MEHKNPIYTLYQKSKKRNKDIEEELEDCYNTRNINSFKIEPYWAKGNYNRIC